MASGPSDYLAAERTFLAWIRTGLALMGFGFVVARFGLFLRALQIGQPALQAPAYGLSFWFGTALIVLGVIVNGWSVRHHLRLVQDLNRGGSTFASPSIAIDLPLKILVWEDGNGKAWVSYNSPTYLQARHNLPAHLVQNIAVVEALAAKAADAQP